MIRFKRAAYALSTCSALKGQPIASISKMQTSVTSTTPVNGLGVSRTRISLGRKVIEIGP